MSNKTYQVVDGPLSVRLEPGGQWLKSYPTGYQFVADSNSETEKRGYIWVQHGEGWSAVRSTGNNTTYLEIVKDDPTPKNKDPEVKPLKFKTNRQVRVRQSPSLAAKHLRWLGKGELIETQSDSRTEADGYIWWQHKDGWSASQSLSGRWVFMQEVEESTTTNEPTTTNNQTTDDPKTTTNKTTDDDPKNEESTTTNQSGVDPINLPTVLKLQAKTDVRIRSEPDLSGNHISWIKSGAVVEFNGSSKVTNDGYVWLHHKDGWSAWKNIMGTDVFLVEPGTVPGIVTMTEDGPDVTTLPYLKTLVRQMPIDINEVDWFQYFGNNVYAYKFGTSWGYDRYAQGLHSGLDFGNNDKTLPIYSVAESKFVRDDRYGVRLKTGSYTIIYQHLINTTPYNVGQAVPVGTKIGDLDMSDRLKHLHFEIRFKGQWIINPLLMMSDTMVEQITSKFNPSRPIYFYKSGAWNKWQTPLDQPVIKLGGPVIGPTAG